MAAARKTAPVHRWASLLSPQFPVDVSDVAHQSAADDELAGSEGAERLEEVVDALRSHRVAQSPVVERVPRQTSAGRQLFSPAQGNEAPRLPTLDVRR